MDWLPQGLAHPLSHGTPAHRFAALRRLTQPLAQPLLLHSVQLELGPPVVAPLIPDRRLTLSVLAPGQLSYPLHAVAGDLCDRFAWLSTG